MSGSRLLNEQESLLDQNQANQIDPRAAAGKLATLPRDVLKHLLSFNTFQEVGRVAQTGKFLNEVAQEVVVANPYNDFPSTASYAEFSKDFRSKQNEQRGVKINARMDELEDSRCFAEGASCSAKLAGYFVSVFGTMAGGVPLIVAADAGSIPVATAVGSSLGIAGGIGLGLFVCCVAKTRHNRLQSEHRELQQELEEVKQPRRQTMRN